MNTYYQFYNNNYPSIPNNVKQIPKQQNNVKIDDSPQNNQTYF